MRGLCSRHSAMVQLWPEKGPCSCAAHSHSSWEYMPLYQGGAMKEGLSGKGQESLSSGRKQERASWRQCAHLTAFSSSLHTALVSTSPTHLFTTPASLLTSSFLPLPLLFCKPLLWLLCLFLPGAAGTWGVGYKSGWG